MKAASFVFILLMSATTPLFASATYCDTSIFGTTIKNDCDNLLRELPGQQALSNPHLFADPQYQTVPFDAIKNIRYPQPIEQLPKIYRFSEFLLLAPPTCLSLTFSLTVGKSLCFADEPIVERGRV